MARILHLVASNHRRGAETFAVELAEHHRAAGHVVRIMAVTASGVDQPLPVEVAATSRFDPRGAARIVRAARWSQVVVSFGSSSLSVGSIAARLAGRPFVYRNIGDPSVWGQVRLSDLRVGAPARSADRVVALYPGAAETLRSLYRIDEHLIRIIPRGVPTDGFVPADDDRRAEAQARLGLDPRLTWVAFVGALSPEKDPVLAIEALALAGDDLGLVIAGGGPLQSEIAELAATYGNRVKILGAVDDVRVVYSSCEALLLPSRTEGIPGAAIEAGMCALPVVTFDVGGVPSVVLHGRTGLVLSDREPAIVASAINEALQRRSELGSEARRHCLEHFSIRTVGEAWGQVISELVDGTPVA